MQTVKRIMGMIAADVALFEEALDACSARWGAVDMRSAVTPFSITDYYESEMGSPLHRRFVSFETLARADDLVDDKLFARSIEQRFVEGEQRRINLDPGWIDLARLVLSTTKDRAHRIYIRDGIYAEVTLTFHREGWEIYPWTYPDFRLPATTGFFTAVRQRYRDQIRTA